MAQQAYTLLLRIFSPFIWAWMAWRGHKAGGVWQIFCAERFGSYPLRWDGEAPVWIHAVSLGETRAAQSLITLLLSQGNRILLTHTTPTGRAEGARLFAAEIASGQLRQQWLPYDFPGATRKFFAHYRPRLALLIEREVWPNLIEQARLADVPVVLASARFSERAQGHVRRIDQLFISLMRDAYASIDLALAQTEDDARRLYEIGAPNVQVVGNLKFDVQLPVVAVEAGRGWRERLGRPIIAIASTREGEDAMFVPAIKQRLLHKDSVITDYHVQLDPIEMPADAPLFLLIPRHPQRFDEAAKLLEAANVKYVRWSTIRHNVDAPQELAQTEVVLCDTLGEMPFFYAASDVAIVAGSFAPHGGQNLIEACAIGTPVIVGPFTRNFADAVDGAVAVGAAIQIVTSELVDPAQRAVATAVSWLQAPEALADRGRLGRDWVAQHTGATQRIVQQLNEFEAARDRSSRHPH